MPPPPSTTLHGVLERIVFLNEENHYTIAEFRPGDGSSKVTVVGALPGVQCGETLAITGQWTRHAQHGDQFKIESFRSELPSTVYGIRKYLGSGLVHGIGKTYAKKIVDKFGTDTLRVISEESSLLKTVPGIGAQRAAAIKRAWDEQSALREVMVFLQTYGATVSQCLRLVKRYGAEAKGILTREPYRVAREIDGIGFKTADRIAVNLGFANDSPPRLDAGILFALDDLQDDGHTAYPGSELVDRATEMLGTHPDLVRARLAALVERRDLVSYTPPASEPVAGEDPALLYQLPANERAESAIAAVLRRLGRASSCLPSIKVPAAVQWAQERAGFTFGEEQAVAIQNALEHKVFVLTGGPGTGKTTILRAIVEILRAKKARVHLAAPTGRAAQRLAATTGGYAQTIHRLLKFDPEKGGFTVNSDHPLATDFLIVDEASMLDVRLAAALFRAVPSGAHLVLVGDIDQLPSVGAGQVLGDLIRSRQIPVVRLNAIYRQKSWSLIVSTAHAINRGEVQMPPAVEDLDTLDPSADMVFITARTPEECLERVLTLCTRILPQRLKLDPREDVQVLAPMHKGVVGVANLNQQLQAAVNRDGGGAFVRGPSGEFRAGDKIIQLRNNYDKGLFNGDIGRIHKVDATEGTMEVDFDGDKQTLDRSDLGDIALAYAISIHKSQGSEYPAVIVPLLKQHFVMLQRTLLYTAVTRGKRRVFLVGDPTAYAMAVRNSESRRRYTTLSLRLRAPEVEPR